MSYKCSACGKGISEYSYICSGCGKVCKEKVVKLSGKKTVDVSKAPAAEPRGQKKPSGPVAVSSAPGRLPPEDKEKKSVIYSKSALDDIKPRKKIELNQKSDFDFSASENLGPSIEIGSKGGMFDMNDLKVDEYKQKTASQHNRDQSRQPEAPGARTEELILDGSFDPSDIAYKGGKYASRSGAGGAKARKPLAADGVLLNKILAANNSFAATSSMAHFDNTKAPNMKLAVLTCSCPSMTGAVEPALGLSPGDAYMVRVLGSSTVESQSSEVMRSLVVGVHLYGVEEIIVISHEDCSLRQLSTASLVDAMRKNHVKRTDIEIADMKAFCGGFSSCKQNIRKTISFIQNSRLIPETVAVHGLMLAPKSLRLEVVVNGYSERVVV